MQVGAGEQGQALWLLQGQPRALQEAMEGVNCWPQHKMLLGLG